MSYMNSKTLAKAVKYIYDNIDSPLTLEAIAKATGVSLATLKRLFIEATNQSIGVFIRRLRMEYAFKTLNSQDNSILETALSVGFEDQSAFARCFKTTFGYTPSVARKKLNIIHELDAVTLEEPVIVDLHDIVIQSVTERGLYYEAAPKAWSRLGKALDSRNQEDSFGVFIGIGHDNPHDGEVAEDNIRFSAGVTLVAEDLKLEQYKIKAGRYARFYYQGKPSNLGLAYHYIYGKFFVDSVWSIDKQPAFQMFERLPDALSEQRIFIYVPISYML